MNEFHDIALLGNCLAAGASHWSHEVDGDFILNPSMREMVVGKVGIRAAVLIGLVKRNAQLNVILTRRAQRLSTHSGQIAFPGGKIDTLDPDPETAALREAWEEIGLERREVGVIGRLPDYHTGSGFVIAPVIGHISPKAGFEINHNEVEYMFEVPLPFLMDQKNYKIANREFNGARWHYYEILFGEHRIWGATAGMIRKFRDRVFYNEAD